jgi:hypothetical protein
MHDRCTKVSGLRRMMSYGHLLRLVASQQPSIFHNKITAPSQPSSCEIGGVAKLYATFT